MLPNKFEINAIIASFLVSKMPTIMRTDGPDQIRCENKKKKVPRHGLQSFGKNNYSVITQSISFSPLLLSTVFCRDAKMKESRHRKLNQFN